MIRLIADIQVASGVDEDAIAQAESSATRCTPSRAGDPCDRGPTGAVAWPHLNSVVGAIQDVDRSGRDKDVCGLVELIGRRSNGPENSRGIG